MRIGELARRAGVSAKTVRFYEQEGLLAPPVRSSNGYRDYPDETARRLEFVRAGQASGLTLAEIRGILEVRDHGQAPCRHVTDLIEGHLAHVESRIRELEHARAALQELHARAVRTDPDECSDADVCSILMHDKHA